LSSNISLYKNINLYIIFAVTLGGIVGVSLLVPVIPPIANHFGVPPEEIGLVITAYTLPGVLFILLMGMLADKVGRKALLVPSLLLFSTAGGSIYWVDDWFWLNVLRFFQGAGGAALPAIAIILIGDLFDEEVRLKVMGLNAAVLSVGTAVFPTLGGWLVGFGWNVPFLVFWFGIPLALFVFIYLTEPANREETDLKKYISGVKPYLLSAEALVIFFISFITFILLYGGFLTYLTLYMDEHFKMTPFEIGLVVSSASIASGITAVILHQLEERIGRKVVLVLGFLLYALSFVSILIIENKIWLFGTFLAFGTAMGATIPIMQNVVASIAPMKYRGGVVSVFGMMVKLGQTLGPPLLAVAFLFNGVELVFYICIAISALVALLLLFSGELFKAEPPISKPSNLYGSNSDKS